MQVILLFCLVSIHIGNPITDAPKVTKGGQNAINSSFHKGWQVTRRYPLHSGTTATCQGHQSFLFLSLRNPQARSPPSRISADSLGPFAYSPRYDQSQKIGPFGPEALADERLFLHVMGQPTFLDGAEVQMDE